MEIIETKVYTLDELTPEAKDKARQWYKEGNDMPNMPEYMAEVLEKLLKDAGITCDNARIYYSLSYSQGDGAMFEGIATWGEYTATIKQRGHYYHYNSKEIELVDDTGESAPEKDHDAFETLYVKVCKDLEKAGYAYLDDENSDENVDDNILANGYTFTESGRRFG